MRFHTTEAEFGWTNVVVSPNPMLKLFQLITALLPARTVVCPPFCVMEPWPRCTVPPTGPALTSEPALTHDSAMSTRRFMRTIRCERA